MKHTKGKWEIYPSGKIMSDQFQDEDGIQSDLICTVNKKCSKSEANAKLIAAAPELLEVCQKAMESEIDGSYVVATKWWDEMKQAIKKVNEINY